MTNEKASVIIGNIPVYGDECYSIAEYQEAKTMAVQALLQEPKTGRWIRMKAYEKWGCSECNTVFRFTFKEHDYCPNCGCAMIEPQETETWNGIHAQITAPKGTFKKILNDTDDEDDI